MKLLLGDCLEKMKEISDKSIDMVLTDPPYGISFQSNYRKIKYDFIEGDQNLGWLPELVSDLFRISKDNTGHYLFCSFHHIDIFKREVQKSFNVKNILIWEKNNTSMGDLKGNFASKTELILFFTKGRPLIRGKRDHNILKFNRTKNELHPTQKPVDLCEFLITKFSDDGSTILDPFMGSGSTGVACSNLRRNFIGIEKDFKYFEIAKVRINAKVLS